MDIAAIPETDLSTDKTSCIPLWLKLAYTAFICVLVPYYLHAYGPGNLLWFCDVALIVTLVGLWTESRYLFSMQAVAIVGSWIFVPAIEPPKPSGPIPSTPMPISSSGSSRVRHQSAMSLTPTVSETTKKARNPIQISGFKSVFLRIDRC